MTARILLVDDDPELQTLLGAGLRQEGYEIETAGDGEQGLAKAKTFKPQLIIADLNMPRMHGYEFCREVRADADLAGTRILVLSGKRFPSDIKGTKTAGADEYLSKPYELGAIIEKVAALLEPPQDAA